MASSSTSANSPTSVPSLSHFPLSLSIKLNHSNYPIWKAQALPYFRGQGVFGYLDGSISIPPKEISSTDATTGVITTIPNPEYEHWIRQDSLILATINTSLTEDVLSQVMTYTTSKDVWSALHQNFSSISRAKAVQLRTQLATSKKGSLSAKDYFLSIKRMADELALAGQPLKPDETLTYILAGLGQEYDSLVSTITSRPEAVTLEEFYSLLLITESRIHQHHDSIPVNASVNMVTRHPSSQSRPVSNWPSSHQGRNNYYRGKGRGGRNFSYANSSNSIVCQVCQKQGHNALKCYHRFDVSYQVSQPQRAPQAFFAARNHQPTTPEWHPDTGATHHLTNDVNNIHLTNDDSAGNDRIQVANGAGLLGEHPASWTTS